MLLFQEGASCEKAEEGGGILNLFRLGSILLLWLALILVPDAGGAAESSKIFLQKCASCHREGGKAEPVSPAAKAGLVWVKYFERKRHPIQLSISDEEMGVILAYLRQHAADSEVPLSAVIPK